jgi:hypothetical protein
MKIEKKAMLGVWISDQYQMGKTGRQTAIQV